MPTQKNKANALTRVRKEWLKSHKAEEIVVDNSCSVVSVKELHDKHHMGVDRTLFLAQKLDPSVQREEVKKVVKFCEEC